MYQIYFIEIPIPNRIQCSWVCFEANGNVNKFTD